MTIAEKTTSAWSSRTGFLLAAIGGAVGLGNLWRFPYVAGEYGGGGFVIVYLAFVFFLGAPLMAGEMLRYRDVVLDEASEALRVRRLMERHFAPQGRKESGHAAA